MMVLESISQTRLMNTCVCLFVRVRFFCVYVIVDVFMFVCTCVCMTGFFFFFMSEMNVCVYVYVYTICIKAYECIHVFTSSCDKYAYNICNSECVFMYVCAHMPT